MISAIIPMQVEAMPKEINPAAKVNTDFLCFPFCANLPAIAPNMAQQIHAELPNIAPRKTAI